MNSMMIILPYRYARGWVFDDPGVGLKREPFVLGMNEIIDDMLDRQFENTPDRFKLFFSAAPFPNFVSTLTRFAEEHGGTWYRDEETDRTGWLCPALFKYFPAAPKNIYAKAELI